MKKCVLILSIFIHFNANAQEQSSGYCGPKDDNGNFGINCEWKYDHESKTLIISGQGAMFTTSSMYDHPWSKDTSFYKDIENIIIENGITNIGSHAFYIATNLKNIKMPDTLTQIGWNVFGGTQLTSYNIPSSVTYIGGDSTHPPFGRNTTEVYCSEAQRKMCEEALSWSGLSIDVLKSYKKDGNEYYYNGRWYKTVNDIGTKNYIVKRIYTIEEANLVAKKTNTVSIKYR